MNRARMEVEDCRAQMERWLKTSGAKQVHHANLYAVGQTVNIKPIFKSILGLPEREHYVRFRLIKQNHQGLWRLAANKGPNKNKELYVDLPEDMLC